MVKVGNSECEFLKLTPLSRTSAIAGALSGVTMRPRRPSGMNRIRLFWANATPADNVIRLADSNTIARMKSPRSKRFSALGPLPPFSIGLRRNCYKRPADPHVPPVSRFSTPS